jgi:hypothetical protein
MVHDTGAGNSRRFISSIRVSHNQACDFVLCDLQRSTAPTNIDPDPHEDHLLESPIRNVKVSATATGTRKGNLTTE